MNLNKSLSLILAAGLGFSATAAAGHDRHAEYAYAKVISATPITEIYETYEPQQRCWNEEVVRHERGGGNLGGLVIGGIVGGVVGNQFGKGRGRDAMTAVGAVTGAAVGNEMTRGPGRRYTTVEERCETVRLRHTEERVVGYDVRYRYNGQDYYTRTDTDPGKRLRVRVSVAPAH